LRYRVHQLLLDPLLGTFDGCNGCLWQVLLLATHQHAPTGVHHLQGQPVDAAPLLQHFPPQLEVPVLQLQLAQRLLQAVHLATQLLYDLGIAAAARAGSIGLVSHPRLDCCLPTTCACRTQRA
jgi:hypothetical protein